MDIDSLTSSHIKKAIELLSKKEALQAQLATVDAQISSLLGGSLLAPAKTTIAKVKSTGKASGSGKTRRRGALKDSIMAELRAAGAEGVSIKNLVDKLSSKSANLHAWFNMTGKRVPGLSKIGRGIYRLVE